jgi:chaperone modulatory protein CbpM
MKIASNDGLSGAATETLSLSDLTLFCETDAHWVTTLVAHGIVAPVKQAAPEWEFTPAHIARARKAARLMRELGLNFASVAFVLDLLEERNTLRRKVAMLEASHFA